MIPASSHSSAHPFDRVEEILFTLDAELRFTYVNAFALNAWNKQAQEILGEVYEDAVPTKAQPEVMATFRHVLSTEQRTEVETFGDRHQGWIVVIVHPDSSGLIVHVRRLARNAGNVSPTNFDALTGCLTRAAFLQAQRTLTSPQVLAIVDLNLLKSVNTLRGHSGGDEHIRTVAYGLREALPGEALICRWGGDEFVILTPGHDQNTVEKLLGKTNRTLTEPVPGVGAFSVGLSIWQAGTVYERAFALADEQLELRKEQLRESALGAREADSLVMFSQELEALRDPGDLIQHALNRLLKLLDLDQAAYVAIEGSEAFFSNQALREGISPSQPALNIRVPLTGTGLINTVYRTRTTAWSTDYPNAPDTMPVMVEQGIKSAVVTPVFSQGQVVAAIILRAVNR